jgi:nucleoside triphosphate diphosphatase
MTHALRPIDRLIAIMARLRDPERGCPWDREQDFATIAPYTIEEAYEVADAIERQDMAALQDELGDLLLQVVFHARMAEEAGLFGFDDVVQAIAEKMVRRHPHVFGDADIASVAAQNEAWEAHKAAERGRQRSRRRCPRPPRVIARRQGLAPGRPHRLRLARRGFGHR